MAPKFEIVFPAHNEAERLLKYRTVEKYDRYFGERFAQGEYSILVVSNGSTDGTEKTLEDIARSSANVRYICIRQKGKGRALVEALKHVTAPLMAFADIDGSAGPEEAEKLLKLARDHDIVAGSRRMQGSNINSPAPLSRKINSALAAGAVRFFTGLQVSDPFCGLKVFRTARLREIIASCKSAGSLIDAEVLYEARRAGMDIKETPVEWSHTPGSKALIIRSDIRNLAGLIGIAGRPLPPGHIALILLLALNFAYFTYYSIAASRLPYSINIVEGAMWASNLWSRSLGYYPDYNQWPYWPTAYAPVFYIAAGWMHKLSGLGLEAGRIISLLSACGIAVLLGINASKRGGGRFWAAAFFLLFLSINTVAYWANLYRVDMLEAFFICLALYIGLDANVNALKMYASSALLCLAFFTKSMIAIPAAVLFVYWAYVGRPALKAAFLFAALTAAAFFAWQAATAGQFASQAFGMMLKFTEVEPGLGIALLKRFISETWPLFIAVMVCFRFRVLLSAERRRAFFLTAGLAASMAYILAAGSRIGSDTNYFIEAYVWLLLLAGSLVSATGLAKGRKAAAGALLCLFALLNLPMPGSYPFFWKDIPAFPGDYFAQEKAAKDGPMHAAAATGKYVIAEDASVAIIAGKGPVFEPYIMDRLWMLGLWDPSRFVSGIEGGMYSLVHADLVWNNTKYIDSPLNRYYNRIRIR
ncbi:MAG: glycosyltransferase [Candidatus Omnitrophica bacterium]|nr:glycosyltransferase [Candidatus Omnitrophota bacterium]MDD5736726.1 glycosyltransferase [Candidatus Omnitrophota bacterium]